MEIVETIRVLPRPYYLHVAIASLKNHDRMEWFVEKATEVGVDEITFLVTRFTERKHVNFERMQKIAVSAMKQSQKAFLPKIQPALVPFERFVGMQPKYKHNFIAHCYEHSEKKLLSKLYEPGQSVTCLIGPEGDFSTDEVELAVNKGYVPVSLGSSRLRAETAALSVCFTVAILNEMG
jgi:16S rRNA (uracil1498-N3)-methyltransferase